MEEKDTKQFIKNLNEEKNNQISGENEGVKYSTSLQEQIDLLVKQKEKL